jgi:HK97 family phage prohead protease
MPRIVIRKGASLVFGKAAENRLEGKTVFFKRPGSDQDIAGVVRTVAGSLATVALAIPNNSGVLVVAKEATVSVQLDDLILTEAAILDGRDVKRWDATSPVESLKSVEIKDGAGNVIDYRDVTFEGYGSTFQGTTPEDRDGDYIMPGAFDATLKQFRKNPVMLTDHARSVRNMMGSYSKVGITERGLALTGKITNSATEDARHVRALVAEGHLKTLSIGGMFYYMDDWKGIEEIRLYETSLVVVPANPDAEFQVRSVTGEIAEKAFKEHSRLNGGEVRNKIHF